MNDLYYTYSIVKKSTLGNWTKAMPSYEAIQQSQFVIKKGKNSDCFLPELEVRLVQLIEQVEEITGGYLTGKLIKEEANNIFDIMLSESIYNESQRIKFSDGWLEKFLRRNEINRLKGPGERDSVNVDEALKSVRKLVEISNMNTYTPDCIFNIDETGLEWRTINKSGYVKGNPKRLKTDRDRITVMVGANMSGTLKVPLLVVGQSECPVGFSKTKQENLKSSFKMFYSFNKSAWVNQSLFMEYLIYLNEFFTDLEMNVIVLCDGPSIHRLPQWDKTTKQLTSQPLSNINLYYLEANCTSMIQPMDQEVIQSFKECYRRLLSRHLLDECKKQINNDPNNTPKVYNFKCNKYIKIKNALKWILESWSYVTQNTLSHAWTKAHFTSALHISSWQSQYADINTNNDIIDIKLLDEFQSLAISVNEIGYCNDIYEMRSGWKEADVYKCEIEAIEFIKKITESNSNQDRESGSSLYISNDDIEVEEELKVPNSEVFTK